MTFLNGPEVGKTMPRTPGEDKTGALPARPVRDSISVQELEKIERDELVQSQQSLSNGGGTGTGSSSSSAGSLGSALTGSTPTTNPSGTNNVTPIQ